MKKFKRLLQAAKAGLVYRNNRPDPSALEDLMMAADRCHPFVFLPDIPKRPKFKPTGDPLTDISDFATDYFEATTPREASEEDHPIDQPFEVFSMEYAGDHYITVPRDDDPIKVYIDAMICEEVGKAHRYYLLVITNGVESVLCLEGDAASAYSSVVAGMLEKLKRFDCGVEKVKENVSYRSKDSKKKKNISKDVVFIVADRGNTPKPALGSRNVEWSHAFEVRGHWRSYPNKPDFVGVDRHGDRTQPGRTWVKHHTRKEDKEFKKKVRVVKT